MKLSLIAITGLIAAAVATPAAAPAPVAKRSDNERTLDLYKRTMADMSSGGDLLKRQSAACWICLASCGFGGGDCGCCEEGRGCYNDCPE